MNQHFRWATRCKQRAVHCVFNEYKHLTHTLQSKARCGTFTLLPFSLPSNDIRKYSRINQKFSHLFCSHKDSPYFCCVYPTPVARRCASNVCEGASGWCSSAQLARGFRVWKPREHTYNIYKKSVNAALSLVRWNLRNFKIWTMMNARGDAYGYAINVCQSVRGGYNFLFYIPSTLLVHTSIHTAWVLLYSSFKSGFLRASTTDG